MIRPIGSRTMPQKDISYNMKSTTIEESNNQSSLKNYCPLPIVEPKKKKIDQLLAEYKQLRTRMYNVKYRLQQLGVNIET